MLDAHSRITVGNGSDRSLEQPNATFGRATRAAVGGHVGGACVVNARARA